MLFKGNDFEAACSGKGFDVLNELPGHSGHNQSGGTSFFPMVNKEAGGASFRLDPVHVKIEVHSIDGFDCESGVVGDDFLNALCYHGPGSGRCAA